MKNTTPFIVIGITTIILIMIIVFMSYNSKPREIDPLQVSPTEYIAVNDLELPDGNIIKSTNFDNNPNKGWIGAQLTDLPINIKRHLKYPDQIGVYVQDTQRSGPAQTAGILPGDIITLVNNVEAQSLKHAINVISHLTPGKSYPFAVFRQGEYLEYAVNVSSRQ